MSFSISQKVPERINLAKLQKEFYSELQNILDWWSKKMVDEENGGFFGRMDGQGKLFPEADKGSILNTRLLWTFSSASIFFKNSNYKRLADRAFEYFSYHFWDGLEGGVLWTVDFQGNPADTQKQIYGQAFSIYALSEYYRLTRNKEALEMAIEIFWLIEKYSLDKERNGYHTAFSREWKNMEDIRLSDKDANEAKIMNTHLHILEAFSNLFKVSPSNALRDSFANIILLILEKFYIPGNGSMHIYCDENWNPKGEDISFGHNVEASWLLWEAAEVLADERILRLVRPVCLHMAKSVLENGLDDDGALFYEADTDGIKDSDKHWWPQAEGVVGFWNAYQVSGQVEFAIASFDCWNFIKKYLIDEKNGEWYWSTDRFGVPNLKEDKAGSWKAPYHNSRMCLEMLRRLN